MLLPYLDDTKPFSEMEELKYDIKAWNCEDAHENET